MLKRYLYSCKTAPWHKNTLFILTILLWLLVDGVRIPGVLPHPQFTEMINPDFLNEMLAEDNRFCYYNLFFMIDFFWAFLLLLAIWKYVKNKFYCESSDTINGKEQKKVQCVFTKKALFFLFTGITIIAYCLDITENIYYVFFYKYVETIVVFKIVAYSLVFLTTVLTFVYYTLSRFRSTILRFLGSALYSLFILAIIGWLLPKAPQVNSIVVNLYEQPIDLMALLVMVPIFSVVLVHYPSYLNIDENQRDWYMSKIKWLFFGIIFYKYKKEYIKSEDGKREDRVNFLYRTLGILFYTAIFYVLGYTSEVNFDWKIQIFKVAIIMLACGIVLLYVLKIQKDTWFIYNSKYLEERFPGFYDGDNPDTAHKETTREDGIGDTKCGAKRKKVYKPTQTKLLTILGPVKCFAIIFGATVLVHVALIVVLLSCKDCRYTEWTVIWSLCCVFLQMVSFIYYRTFRSVLRFVFFKNCTAILNAFYILRNIKLVESSPKTESTDVALTIECKKKYILSFFQDIKGIYFSKMHKNFSWYFKMVRCLGAGALSNNVTFLQINTVMGTINAVFFILLNIYSELAIQFNPILIILSGFFFYYGILIILTKHLIYFNTSKENFAFKYKGSFNFSIILGVLLLVVCLVLEERFSNNLFTLPMVDRNPKQEVTLKKFVKDLPEDQMRYYIGCYGGGMKSNAWTMTVLNELYKRDNDFFKKTVGISGASGGTIGLINMAAIMNANKTDKKWSNIIEDISTENILSLDLVHALGRDMLNASFVPYWNLSGKDRSTKAMERYASITGNQDEICKPTPYRIFWKKLYEDYGNRFPILISNSTNVEGNGGMAVSIDVQDQIAKEILYQGADDMLEIVEREYDTLGKLQKRNKKTLGYFDAASTSNRFPLLSPAAKIETKGHYNDGGIYENAGLISAYKLFRAVNYCENIESLNDLKQCNVFISIVNDKEQYIKHRLEQEKLKIEVNKVHDHIEVSTLLSSIVATEMFPIHVKSELKTLAGLYENIEFETIYLPHRFTIADIEAMYGKELDIGLGIGKTSEELYKVVKKNDLSITDSIRKNDGFWTTPIIEPPMSRVMADDAYQFMKRMLSHSTTERSLKRVRDIE